MSNSPLSQRSRSNFQTSNSTATKHPRTCRFCFKSFFKAEHLSRHERSHTKERPYRCSDCGKSYTRHDTLLRHRRSHEIIASEPETTSDNDELASPSMVDHAAATLLELQALTDRPIDAQDQPISSHVHHGNPDERTERSQMKQSLHNEERHPTGNGTGVSVDLSSQGLLDPALEQYSNNSQSNVFPFLPHMELWNLQNESFPSWHIGDDFDIEAFNMSLLSPMAADQSVWHGQTSTSQENELLALQIETQNSAAPSMNDIQGLWVTKADYYSWKDADNASYSVAPTRPITPSTESPSGNTVDERYRNDLSQRLCPRWKEDPLPPTEFLNLALQLFFTKFNPIFPILHGPTFRPSNENSLLLLSICSIGSLFMGSSAATVQGSKIFERLNKVILASVSPRWDTIITRKSSERISLVQASVLGQTFAYLSGNPKYMATVEAFHGTVIAFARRCGMLNGIQCTLDLGTESPQGLDDAWNVWARSEEVTRTALGLYVHDAQLATTFHHDPVFRHNAIRVSVAANNDLFNAPNAAQWANLVRSSMLKPTKLSSHLHLNQDEHSCSMPLLKELACKNSSFSCYVLLHGIGAAVQESNAAGQMTQTNAKRYQDALICWYHAYGKAKAAHEPDPLCQMILCHEIFMSLLVDFNELERAMGRDGASERAASLKYVGQWSSSVEAKRCVVHATLIHRQIGGMRIDSEPAIHVPRSVFLAAIAWYCYIQFDQAGSGLPQTFGESLDSPESKVFGINPLQLLFEASGFKMEKPKLTEVSPLRGLTDMLHRIGRWGISRRFARILGLLIYGDSGIRLMDAI
ncbi:uncharacterized protein PAC_14993 [Phialocephala subalpina]|uniref:C2H2-type domain-containing protein n=1 Tax=Phialocephala subalpina TaxID=576137 RepID=A0A1L7XJA0_9HELO|nr:uncharacterized protein PAC_14993 [Phialocephala subalpina]